MQVITSHDYPPIPDRGMDWSAHMDAENGPYGRGPTELAAAIDLLHMMVADECDLETFIAGLEKVMQLEANEHAGVGYRNAMRTVLGFV